jgi:NAD(P)-dependent dehydrogenase (short-subunit alcohol dehydrogenase family)
MLLILCQVYYKNCLAGLVNNAGIAVAVESALAVDEFRQQFEVNFFGELPTQAFAPLLGSEPATPRTAGRIINISSLWRQTRRHLAPYVASKHALEGWSECLRRELLLFGIDVIGSGTRRHRHPYLAQNSPTRRGCLPAYC